VSTPGAIRSPERITVSAYFGRWGKHLEVQDKPRRTTRHEYARLTRTRIIPAIGGHELAKIRPAHCQAVIDAATAEGVKHAPRDVARKVDNVGPSGSERGD
jgi:hypothetical protein